MRWFEIVVEMQMFAFSSLNLFYVETTLTLNSMYNAKQIFFICSLA